MDAIKILLVAFLTISTSYGEEATTTDQNPITDSLETTTDYKNELTNGTHADIKNLSGIIGLTTPEESFTTVAPLDSTIHPTTDPAFNNFDFTETTTEIFAGNLGTEPSITTPTENLAEEATLLSQRQVAVTSGPTDGQKSADGLMDVFVVTSGGDRTYDGDEKLIVVTPFKLIDETDGYEEKVAIVTAINEDIPATTTTTESDFDEDFSAVTSTADFDSIFQQINEDVASTTPAAPTFETTEGFSTISPRKNEETELNGVTTGSYGEGDATTVENSLIDEITTKNILETTTISSDDIRNEMDQEVYTSRTKMIEIDLSTTTQKIDTTTNFPADDGDELLKNDTNPRFESTEESFSKNGKEFSVVSTTESEMYFTTTTEFSLEKLFVKNEEEFSQDIITTESAMTTTPTEFPIDEFSSKDEKEFSEDIITTESAMTTTPTEFSIDEFSSKDEKEFSEDIITTESAMTTTSTEIPTEELLDENAKEPSEFSTTEPAISSIPTELSIDEIFTTQIPSEELTVKIDWPAPATTSEMADVDKKDTSQDKIDLSRNAVTEINIVEIFDGQRLVRTFPDNKVTNSSIEFFEDTEKPKSDSIVSLNLVLETTTNSEEIIEDLSSFMEIDKDFLENYNDGVPITTVDSDMMNELDSLSVIDTWKSEIMDNKSSETTKDESEVKIENIFEISSTEDRDETMTEDKTKVESVSETPTKKEDREEITRDKSKDIFSEIERLLELPIIEEDKDTSELLPPLEFPTTIEEVKPRETTISFQTTESSETFSMTDPNENIELETTTTVIPNIDNFITQDEITTNNIIDPEKTTIQPEIREPITRMETTITSNSITSSVRVEVPLKELTIIENVNKIEDDEKTKVVIPLSAIQPTVTDNPPAGEEIQIEIELVENEKIQTSSKAEIVKIEEIQIIEKESSQSEAEISKDVEDEIRDYFQMGDSATILPPKITENSSSSSAATPENEETLIEVTEPFIIGEIQGKSVNFTVKITDKDSSFFLPPDTHLVATPDALNLTWRSISKNLNNSLALNLGRSIKFVQLNLVKDDRLHTHKKIESISSDGDKSQERIIELGDDIRVVLSNVDFWGSYQQEATSSDEPDALPSSPNTPQKETFVVEIVGGCLGCTVLIGLTLFYLVKIVKGRRTQSFKPNEVP